MKFDPNDESTWPTEQGKVLANYAKAPASANPYVVLWDGDPDGWGDAISSWVPLPSFDAPAMSAEDDIAAVLNKIVLDPKAADDAVLYSLGLDRRGPLFKALLNVRSAMFRRNEAMNRVVGLESASRRRAADRRDLVHEGKLQAADLAVASLTGECRPEPLAWFVKRLRAGAKAPEPATQPAPKPLPLIEDSEVDRRGFYVRVVVDPDDVTPADEPMIRAVLTALNLLED